LTAESALELIAAAGDRKPSGRGRKAAGRKPATSKGKAKKS
jgi:hypothetical protein